MAGTAETSDGSGSSSSSPSFSSSEIRMDQIFALNEKTSRFAVLGPLHNGMEVMLRFFKDSSVCHALQGQKESIEDRWAATNFIQRYVTHWNVLGVVGICRELGTIAIEVCEPLREFLASCSHVPLGMAARMGLGCVEGLIHLHDALGEVWERDGSPLEFFVAGNTIKVADDQVSSPYFVLHGERVRYSAPEILATQEIAPAAKAVKNMGALDVYSVGVVMWSLLCRSEPWVDKKTDEIKQMVLRGERPAIPEAIARNLQQEQSMQSYLILMNKCWRQNSNERPTLMEVRGGLLEILSLIEEEEASEWESIESAVVVPNDQYWVGNAGSAARPEAVSVIAQEGPQRGLPPIVPQGTMESRGKGRLIAFVQKVWRALAGLFRLRRNLAPTQPSAAPANIAIGIRAPSPTPAIGVPFNPAQCQVLVSPFSRPPPLSLLNPLCNNNNRDNDQSTGKQGLGTMMVVDREPNQTAWGKIRGYSVNCILPDATKHPVWNDVVVIAIGNAAVPPRKIWDDFLDIFFNTSAPEFRQSEHWDVLRPWLVKPMVPKVERDLIKWVEPERGSSDFANNNVGPDGRLLLGGASTEFS
ncbi:hypothetical protein BSKO_10748 [Bryopsis sp. KO-2023]|nr:hypothetical protein BSKO_10748 [Bryopsis sp. KO-2023]